VSDFEVHRRVDPEGVELAQRLLNENRDSVLEVSRTNWWGIIPNANYTGSGFFVRTGEQNGKGYCDVVTVNDVISDANGTPYLKTSDNNWHASRVLHQNPETNIALLRIDGIDHPETNCKTIALGDGEPTDSVRAVRVSARDGKWQSEYGSFIETGSRAHLRMHPSDEADMSQPMNFYAIPGDHGDSGSAIVSGATGKAEAITEGGSWNGTIAIPAPYIQRALDETRTSK